MLIEAAGLRVRDFLANNGLTKGNLWPVCQRFTTICQGFPNCRAGFAPPSPANLRGTAPLQEP